MGEGPHVLMNGVPLDKKHLEEGLLTELMKETQMIQEVVYSGRYGRPGLAHVQGEHHAAAQPADPQQVG